MLELLQKYANAIIAIVTAGSMTVGAIYWVPDTFMTKADAIAYHESLTDEALERDKDLQRSIEWNYLETQIGINTLVMRGYKRRIDDGTLTEHDDDYLAYQAIQRGQVSLIERRNELTQARPEWAE